MGRIGIDQKRSISETQEMVFASVRDGAKWIQPPPVNLTVIEAVSDCSEEEAVAYLGNAGKIIKRFASQTALSHPDMVDLSHEKDWEAFSSDVFQALAAPVEDLKATINSVYKPILRLMSVTKPRMIASQNRRNEIRQEKKHPKHIGLKQVYMLGENGFYGKPDDFKMFVRNSNIYLEEIENLDERQKTFVSHAMPEVANAVRRRISALKEMHDSSYLGFHRLRPTDAAMIAARMIGLRWHEQHFLTVPFKFFEQRYWEDPVDVKEAKSNDEMKRLLVMKGNKSAFVENIAFQYQPRLYPFGKFPGMSKGVTEIVNIVEAFTELNGSPVFDYYWVMVPSININHPFFFHKDEWKVPVYGPDEQRPWNRERLTIKSFTDEFEAALALDTTLVADDYFVPVILGEREGRCYFLSL